MQDNLKTNPGAKARKGIAGDSSSAKDSRGTTPRQKASSRPAEPARSKAKTGAIRPASKQAQVIELLRRKEGASVAAIMKLTGWQKHSVHGFFAGIIRKKLQLNFVRSGQGDDAVYRIVTGMSAVSKPGKVAKPGIPRKSAARKSSHKRAR